MLLLLPLWWVLGIEQFIWPVVLFWSTLKILLSGTRVLFPAILQILTLFIAVYLISAFFIIEPVRYVTYLRTLGTYMAAWFIIFILANTLRDWTSIRRFIQIIAISMLIAVTVGALGITGIFRPSFSSLMGQLLPSWITDTAFGGNIAQRNLGFQSWFSWFGNYFRISSFFLWPTTYAPALALTFPVMLYLFQYGRHRYQKLFWSASLMLLLLNLLFTTGRIAALALLCGAVFWYFLSRHHKLIYRLMVFLLLFLVALLGSFLSPVEVSPQQLVSDFVFARGSGSPSSRLIIYQKTLEGFLERPIFGWGTERDIADTSDSFIYPAGSHSYYLGVLYKQGIVGFVIFMLLWLAIWRASEIPKLATPPYREQIAFLFIGRWIIVTAMIIALTTSLDLDALVMLFFWTLIGLLIATQRLIIKERL